jgi:hypothetical protein
MFDWAFFSPSRLQAPAPEDGKPAPMRAAGSTVLKVFPIKVRPKHAGCRALGFLGLGLRVKC